MQIEWPPTQPIIGDVLVWDVVADDDGDHQPCSGATLSCRFTNSVSRWWKTYSGPNDLSIQPTMILRYSGFPEDETQAAFLLYPNAP